MSAPTVTGRGSTRRGRPAPLPDSAYGNQAQAPDQADGLVVSFRGEDGREATFQVDALPLPGWHAPLAAALASRVGPAGGLRTLVSARNTWKDLRRFLRFLDSLAHPPAEPSQLSARHVERFIWHLNETLREVDVPNRVGAVARVLNCPPLASLVPAAALESVNRRWTNRPRQSRPGYSSRELARLLTAARRDVAALRDRIEGGRRLLTDSGSEPTGGVSREALMRMARTGEVPRVGLPAHQAAPARRALAGQLFVTMADLAPLLVLLVAVTGRNVETIKELPAEHRILDEQAVQLRLTKRRRGVGQWTETVAWEIGPPHRQLHTPGGLYLLAHRLCETGRVLSDSKHVWSIWRGGTRDKPAEHVDPFADDLTNHSPYLRNWVTTHSLTTDTHTASATPMPFRLDFNRLKTSIEVRRTRQMGGHLPSAARANTVGVLFSSYLRDDPTTIDWAQQIVGDAVRDAERAALDAHHRAVLAAGGGPRITIRPDNHADTEPASPTQIDDRVGEPSRSDQHTGWSSCVDPQHHPASGQPCRASLLDCFHCGNALITPDHLPRLLALLDALSTRRQQMPERDWWARYGSAWAALRHDVLGKFSPAELERATANKPTDALLDLVEDPWNQP